MSFERVLSVQAAVRGFHVYKNVWEPKESETLVCSHEKENVHDPFAIKTYQRDSERIVGHLPMELSRITKFLLDRGARMEAKLRETHYRRSPLVQGGLEIPCDLIIRMPNTVKNDEILEHYLELFEERYEEPQEMVKLGTFGPRPEVDIRAEPRREVTIKIPSGGKEKKRKEGVKSKDIRTMFRKAERNAAGKLPVESEDCVILD